MTCAQSPSEPCSFGVSVSGLVLPLPELQDAGDIPRGENPPYVVEVSHVQTSIRAARQSHGGQQLVSVSEAVTAGAGDAAPAPVSHHTANYRGLLGDEDVLSISHVKDTWLGGRAKKEVTPAPCTEGAVFIRLLK